MAKYTVDYLDENRNSVSQFELVHPGKRDEPSDFSIRKGVVPINLLHGGQPKLYTDGRVFASASEFQFDLGAVPDVVDRRGRRELRFDLGNEGKTNSVVLTFNSRPNIDTPHYAPEEKITDRVKITYHK